MICFKILSSRHETHSLPLFEKVDRRLMTDISSSLSSTTNLLDTPPQVGQHTYILASTVNAGDISPEKIFYFLCNMDKYYLQLSDGHESFKITNTPSLQLGSVIDNKEKAGGQTITHRYVVTEVTPNRYLKIVSDASNVRGECCCCCYYNATVKTTVEFGIHQDKETKDTKLSARLILEFGGGCTKWFAGLFGTEAIWQRHLEEELRNGTAIIRSSAFNADYERHL